MLQGNPSQERASCTWTEDQDKCKDKKRSEENGCKQEEIKSYRTISNKLTSNHYEKVG